MVTARMTTMETMETPQAHRAPELASFVDFDPRAYVDEYYGSIGEENDALLRFFAQAYRDVPTRARMLEFGCGPTIYQLISAAPRVASIDLAEPSAAARAELSRWIAADPSAFDWTAFVSRALSLEDGRLPDPVQVGARCALIRRRVRSVIACDAFAPHPLEGVAPGSYDVVASSFVLDSVTDQRTAWRDALVDLTGLARVGGVVILASLLGAEWWTVGARRFPAVALEADEIVSALNGAGCTVDLVQTIGAEEGLTHGYRGMAFIRARRTT